MNLQNISQFIKTGTWGGQSEVTLFLAKVFGIYLIIMGLYLLLRYDHLKNVASDFVKFSGLQAMGGALSLIVGLLVVVSHNVWVWNWPVIITLLGYMAVLKGINRLFFSDWEKKMVNRMNSTSFFIYMGAFTTLLGLFLAYKGFWS